MESFIISAMIKKVIWLSMKQSSREEGILKEKSIRNLYKEAIDFLSFHVQKMPLWVRTYKCENCLFEMCRDENSAKNIKNLGLGQSYVEIMSDSSSGEQLSVKQEAITSTGVRL